MQFERRDFILIAASIMLMLGLSPFIGMAYALAVALLLYFGTKVFVGRRRRRMMGHIGEGLCAECGSRLRRKKCPKCDSRGAN